MRLWESQSEQKSGYIPLEESVVMGNKVQAPYAKMGDFVRYFDLDGGREDGQTLVGKISFFQKKQGEENGWLVEVTELEDLGDGYYYDYPSRKRSSKRSMRDLEEIAPLTASFVRTENAFKVPRDRLTLQPSPSFPKYKVDGFTLALSTLPVNQDVLSRDGKTYNELKFKLFKDVALYSLVGAVLTDLFRGLEDTLVYTAGAVAGLGYLFFLTVKTDTLGSTEAKMGSNIANLRFALPIIVLLGVSIGNVLSASSNNALEISAFRTVSTDQFAAAMAGFLTYRLPLYISQLTPVIGESAAAAFPTGSAGMALEMLKESKESSTDTNINDESLVTILLISGPHGTGKTTLVNRLIAESNGKFISPDYIDNLKDPTTFEQMERRNALVQVDRTGRYGLTIDSLQKSALAAAESTDDKNIIVIDASVDLAKRLVKSLPADFRLVGVWIGLDTLDKFESRLQAQLQSGDLEIMEDETSESTIRAKLREAVKDIEYGVVSGVFEFTILNDDIEKSLIQLKEAAGYCFK